MIEPVWIPKDVVLALHARQLAEHGGTDGTRDEGLLESALARPQQRWVYGSPPPDLCSPAASNASSLAKNHPFLDGNKRTAHVVYRLFLKRNGLDLTATMEERYLGMWRLAAGEIDEGDFVIWLRANTAPVDAKRQEKPAISFPLNPRPRNPRIAASRAGFFPRSPSVSPSTPEPFNASTPSSIPS